VGSMQMVGAAQPHIKFRHMVGAVQPHAEFMLR
jgi:hypothetical protein